MKTVVYLHSDHECLSLAITGSGGKDSAVPPYLRWRLNDSLLENAACEFELRTCISIFSLHEDFTGYLWDFFKYRIKVIAIKHGRILSRREREEESRLLRLLDDARSTIGIVGATERYAEAERLLRRVEDRKAAAASVRSRLRHLEHCEAPTTAFLALERERARRLMVSSIRLGQQTVTDGHSICKGFVNYYSEVFSPPMLESLDINALPELVCQHLAPELQELLCRDITISEIANAIEKLNSRSAPGLDGLTARFYKHFKVLLCPILLKVFSHATSGGFIPLTMRVGNTIFLPKPRQDVASPPTPANFRPITLLATDYKIWANILANRLKMCIHSIIPPVQVCAIPQRSIKNHLFTLQLLTQCSSSFQTPLYILSVDIAHAFDAVRWEILWGILRCLRIPESWLHQLQLLYARAANSLSVNGALSAPINLKCSVRQGCPLSPLLFDIYLLPLYNMILNNDKLAGVHLPSGEEVKMIAYADDIYICVPTVDDLHVALRILSDFQAISGARINYAKTTGVAWFPTEIHPDLPSTVTWSTTGFKALGIPFPSPAEERQVYQTFVSKLLNTVQRKCHMWKRLNLSIYARAKVWNSIITSALWYYVPYVPMENCFFRKLLRIGALFIWSPARCEIGPRDRLFAPVGEGGLGLDNVKLRTANLVLKYFHQMLYSPQPWAASARILLMTSDVILFPAPTPVRRPQLPPVVKVATRVVHYFLPRLSRTLLFGSAVWKSRYKDLIGFERDRLGATQSVAQDAARICAALPTLKVTPHARTVQWKILHHALPTGAWAWRRRFVPDQFATCCPFCGETEDISHLFQRCHLTTLLWAMLRTTDLPHPSYPHQLMYPPVSGDRQDLGRLICEANSVIWRARNEAKFSGIKPCLFRLFAKVLYHFN